jgi:hypothetical protein
MIRSPGLAGDPPAWFGQADDLPRAVHAGPWIAQHGQFFDGWGRRADHAELPSVAAAQAARTGWAKIIGDWGPDDEPVPADVLAVGLDPEGSLIPGAHADAVIYDADPRTDLTALDRPPRRHPPRPPGPALAVRHLKDLGMPLSP